MNYTTQRYLSIAIAVFMAVAAAIQAFDPADLGLTPIQVRWLGIGVAAIGALGTFLPSARNLGGNPSFLANRLSELTTADRTRIAREVHDRTGDVGHLSDADIDRITRHGLELMRQQEQAPPPMTKGEATLAALDLPEPEHTEKG